MGLRKRLIARLDIKPPNLIKGIHLEGFRVIGNPAEYAQKYAEEGIDEILYMDCVASLYGRNSLHELVEETTAKVFVPVSVGGGIRSIADCKRLFDAGADKLCINTAAIRKPTLVREISDRYGSQAICVSIEAKRTKDGWEAYTDNGREKTGKDALSWARQAERLGAGEILVTSIDNEGTRNGFDADLIKAIEEIELQTPIIASGGAGTPEHIFKAIKNGADGIAIASILHYKTHTIQEILQEAQKQGIPLGH